MTKKLAVFDFDHTIIHDNSDIVVMNMIDQKKIPATIKQLHRSDGWTAFMQAIFNLLHNHSITEDKIKNIVDNLPGVPGMSDLIKELSEKLNSDVIIISDSNSYFINTWLEAKGLKKNVVKVFTNPAYFDNRGLLNITMYHLQDFCKLSTKNLCKGQIMEDFIEQQKCNGTLYNQVIYCGDGLNDFCPILRLREDDLACVRKKFKCAEIVKKSKDGLYKDESGQYRVVKANIIEWDTGFEILDYIKKSQT